MKIENQVCTLEQAKKLKELGVIQKAYFSWCGDETHRLLDNCAEGVVYGQWVFVSNTEPFNNMEADYRQDVDSANPIASSFTVSELAKMIKGGSYESERLWNRMLSRINGGNSCVSFYDASFLAEFLIEILEAKYLSVKACNERLLA